LLAALAVSAAWCLPAIWLFLGTRRADERLLLGLAMPHGGSPPGSGSPAGVADCRHHAGNRGWSAPSSSSAVRRSGWPSFLMTVTAFTPPGSEAGRALIAP
jgi:hypothetical protein